MFILLFVGDFYPHASLVITGCLKQSRFRRAVDESPLTQWNRSIAALWAMGREGHLHRCLVTNLAECQKYRNFKILGSVLSYYGHYTVGLYCGTLWYLELNVLSLKGWTLEIARRFNMMLNIKTRLDFQVHLKYKLFVCLKFVY